MVDVITPTVTQFANGVTPALLLTFTDLNGDGEYGIFDMWSQSLTWLPAGFACMVERTAGENAGDVDVDVSMDGTNWTATSINNITTFTAVEHYPTPDWGEPDLNHNARWRYLRAITPVVGAGNTITIYVWIYGK